MSEVAIQELLAKSHAGTDRASALSDLETEVIGLFAQMSRALGIPCKIYNILGVSAPVLYIGPAPSHVTEILDELASPVCPVAAHGEVDRCVQAIVQLAAAKQRGETEGYATVSRKFGQPTLLPRLVAELERA